MKEPVAVEAFAIQPDRDTINLAYICVDAAHAFQLSVAYAKRYNTARPPVVQVRIEVLGGRE